MYIDDIVKQACEQPTLLEALTFACTLENNRAVKQALDGYKGPNGERWDTCFGLTIKRVMEHWNATDEERLQEFLQKVTRVAEHVAKGGCAQISYYGGSTVEIESETYSHGDTEKFTDHFPFRWLTLTDEEWMTELQGIRATEEAEKRARIEADKKAQAERSEAYERSLLAKLQEKYRV